MKHSASGFFALWEATQHCYSHSLSVSIAANARVLHSELYVGKILHETSLCDTILIFIAEILYSCHTVHMPEPR